MNLPATPKEIVDRSFERRIDLVAHALRVFIGVVVLVASWTTDIAGDDRAAFTAFMVVFFLPLSPVDYLLTPRFAGTVWFDGAIAAGHTTSLFALAWLAPSLRVLALLGYLVMVVVFTMNGGRIMGFIVTAIATPLMVLAEALAPADERLSPVSIVMAVAACGFVTVMIHAVTAERAQKAHDLEAALEAERAALVRVESAMRAKDRFVESVTHELRTPLTVVIGALGLLQSSTHLDDDNRALLLDKALSRASDLDLIVAHVTEYTTLESALTVAPSSSAVRPMIDGAVAEAAGSIGARQVHVECPVNLDAWADGDTMRHVVALLLDNAAKFSPEDSTISIVAARDGANTSINISDQGRGIAPEDVDGVFEPFQQSGEILPGTMGIGVGLTLAKRLCEHQQGSITLCSTVGVGTTVSIRVPATGA